MILNNSWNQICQIIEENGFIDSDLRPNLFLTLNKSQLYVLITLILNDLRALWITEIRNSNSYKFKFLFLIQTTKNKYNTSTSVEEYSFYVSTSLLSTLYSFKNPYSICFIIMSALFRL
jgi:hypothetical protein